MKIQIVALSMFVLFSTALAPSATAPQASANQYTEECDITMGSAAGQMFSMFAVRVGGCYLDFVTDNLDAEPHTPPGCTIFYDDDADQTMDGEVTDHVQQGWDLYGYCDLPNLGATIGITYRW